MLSPSEHSTSSILKIPHPAQQPYKQTIEAIASIDARQGHRQPPRVRRRLCATRRTGNAQQCLHGGACSTRCMFAARLVLAGLDESLVDVTGGDMQVRRVSSHREQGYVVLLWCLYEVGGILLQGDSEDLGLTCDEQL